MGWYAAGRARIRRGCTLLACMPSACIFCPRPASTGWRAVRWPPRSGFGRQPCALRGDYDTGFCALSAVLRVCDGAGAKAAAPMARAAIIAVFIVLWCLRWHDLSKDNSRGQLRRRGGSCESVHRGPASQKTDVPKDPTFLQNPRRRTPHRANINRARPTDATQTSTLAQIAFQSERE